MVISAASETANSARTPSKSLPQQGRSKKARRTATQVNAVNDSRQLGSKLGGKPRHRAHLGRDLVDVPPVIRLRKNPGRKVAVAALRATKRDRNVDSQRIHQVSIFPRPSYTEIKTRIWDFPSLRMSNPQDDVIGKVYDSRLMRRLLKYLQSLQAPGRDLVRFHPAQGRLRRNRALPLQGGH